VSTEVYVTTQTGHAPPRQEGLPVKLALLLASGLTILAGAIVSPALPDMEGHFASVANADFLVRLVLTLPSLVIALTAPLVGMVADRWGRKPVLLAALVLYGLAGSSGFVLDSLYGILAGRALLGVAVAGIMTSVTALIADYYAGEARAAFMGLQAAFIGFGGVVILTGGGVLAEIGWRAPFAVYLIALAIVPLAFRALYDPPRIDTSDTTAAQATDSAVPVRMIGFIYLIMLFIQSVFYLIPTQLPFYVRNDLDTDNTTLVGIAMATGTGVAALSSLASRRLRGWMVQRSGMAEIRTGGYLQVLGLAFALMSASFAGIALAQSYAWLLPAMVLNGLGFGLVIPTMNIWLTAVAPARLRGRAVGGLSSAMFVGHFLSPVISEPLSDAVGLDTTYGIAGMALIAVAAGLLLAQRLFPREEVPALVRA